VKHPFDEIVTLLRSHSIKFEELNHEPIITSEQAAVVRGLSMHSGAKSLLLKTGDQFILAVLPGDKKLDSKKLRDVLGVKHLHFATPTEVEEVMGCQIGSCYPFGSIAETKMVVDPSLGENEFISFSPGIHNKSIKISWADYLKATDTKLIDISI
jgi:Ala-tRNA(Pro) deacylase